MQAKVLIDGTAHGEVIVLDEPLSFWGGLNPNTGEITDRHHPQSGMNLAGKILVMPAGRGSSSGSSILLEATRQKMNPVAIIMSTTDGLVALGAVVAQEMYSIALPMLVVPEPEYSTLKTGQTITIESGGIIHVT